MCNDLHVPGIWLKNFLTWRKRLLIHTVFILIDLKTDRLIWSSIAQKARVSFVAYKLYLHVSVVFITKQKSLGWSKTSKRKRTFEFMESIGRKDQLYIHRLIWFEFISIVGSQLHCALGFTAHRCDNTWIFRHTTKNPVAYATS